MAKKKVYAVRKGKKTGLFYSWNECETVVSGYPGAEYKGFATEEEANAYLGVKQEIVGDHNTDEITDNKLLLSHDEHRLVLKTCR